MESCSAVAIDTQATLVPLVLVGAYDYHRKGDWRTHPGFIDLYVEDPLDTQGMTKADVPALLERTRSVYERRLRQA